MTNDELKRLACATPAIDPERFKTFVAESPLAELPLFHELVKPRFDGATYDKTRDQKRLTGQLLRVFTLMSDGQWRTLHEIQQVTMDSEAGISARLRDLRKVRFGGHTVERRRRTRAQWEYSLVVRSAGA